MPNMSYCRFRNTAPDLRDCLHNFWNVSSEDEARARKRLVALAKQVVSEAESNPEAVENCEYDEESYDDED